MPVIRRVINIERPIEEVFQYITTPGHWPEWHPSSHKVIGVSDHSLDVGEQVTEEIQVAGRRDTVVWTVSERQAPHRWVFEGESEGGGRATIVYILTPEGQGTRFERELVYTMPNRLSAVLDRLIIGRLMDAASTQALRRLKEILEQQGMSPGRPAEER